MNRQPQDFSRVLSSMCTEPHPAALEAAETFLATNPGDPGTFPTIAELERAAVSALGSVVGLESPAGYIGTGGTEANVQAMRLARERSPAESPNVVVPDSAHFSFDKAAALLDVELRRVPLGPELTVDLDQLDAAVDANTALVVAVAGTTEYGRVDPVPAVAEVAASIDARLHVDAAWGGFHLPFTDHEWHFGHAPVDSMTIDPHKVGQAAIPAGGFLVRDGRDLDALTVETPYLVTDEQPTLVGTRSGAGVASTLAAIEALWPTGYRDEHERAMRLTRWLESQLTARGFSVVDPVLPIVTVSIESTIVENLRERGWRLSCTTSGEARIVVMPHVTRSVLEAFLTDLDACTESSAKELPAEY